MHRFAFSALAKHLSSLQRHPKNNRFQCALFIFISCWGKKIAPPPPPSTLTVDGGGGGERSMLGKHSKYLLSAIATGNNHILKYNILVVPKLINGPGYNQPIHGWNLSLISAKPAEIRTVYGCLTAGAEQTRLEVCSLCFSTSHRSSKHHS